MSLPLFLYSLVTTVIFLGSLGLCSKSEPSSASSSSTSTSTSTTLMSTVLRYASTATDLPRNNEVITKQKRDEYFSHRKSKGKHGDGGNSSVLHDFHYITLFISITSGPNHQHLRHAARSTWLVPCKVSSICNYRFFVDAPDSYIDKELQEEIATFGDITTRNGCPNVQASVHPIWVNYGNSPPSWYNSTTPLKMSVLNQTEIDRRVATRSHIEGYEIPDYPSRRFYKIDWKICFFQWIERNKIKPDFHVFVEDDSFSCTENLIFQTQILSSKLRLKLRGKVIEETEVDENVDKTQDIEKNNNKEVLSVEDVESGPALGFRTGTHMFDGFDDSSTIISSDVAAVFLENYNVPNKDFNCSTIRDHIADPDVEKASQWLSWGNSWIFDRCDWRNEILSKFSLNLNVPDLTCLHGFMYVDQPMRHKAEKSMPFSRSSKESTPNRFYNKRYYPDIIWGNSPKLTELRNSRKAVLNDTLVHKHCHEHPIIFHHSDAANIMLEKEKEKVKKIGGDNLGNSSKSKDNITASTVDNGSGPRHMCEYMLSIDKVKDVSQIYELWNTAVANSYIDFSSVFLQDGARGWLSFIESRIAEEKQRSETSHLKVDANGGVKQAFRELDEGHNADDEEDDDDNSLLATTLKAAGLPYNPDETKRFRKSDPGILQFISVKKRKRNMKRTRRE